MLVGDKSNRRVLPRSDMHKVRDWRHNRTIPDYPYDDYGHAKGTHHDAFSDVFISAMDRRDNHEPNIDDWEDEDFTQEFVDGLSLTEFKDCDIHINVKQDFENFTYVFMFYLKHGDGAWYGCKLSLHRHAIRNQEKFDIMRQYMYREAAHVLSRYKEMARQP